MPRFTSIVFSFLLLLTFFSFQTLAQVPPNGINYQAVVRDVSGSELTNTAVVFRFTIRTGSTSGTIIYQETQNAVTNSYGLVFLVIGQGTQTIASPGNSLSQLDWLDNSTFVNVEIAIGASPFTSMGSSQYLTTPYSFVSGTAISVSGGNVNAANLDIVNGVRFESMNKNGAVLTVDGTGRVGAGYITGTSYTAGSGISITGSNQIINTGGNINLTGVGTTILGSGTSNPTVVGQKLVAGSNITITGSTISAAAPTGLTAGSNVTITGGAINVAAPLTAGSNITITGSAINAAAPTGLTAGSNITISGNTISAAGSQWQNNGQTIYYNTSFVGIGTSLPAATLDVNGNSIFRDSLVIGTTPYSVTPPQVHIYTNPSAAFLVEDIRLTGGGCNTGGGPMMTFQNACGGSTNSQYQDWITAAIGSPYSGSYQGDLTFYTNDGASAGYASGSIGNSNFERMRITSLGNVGIGTSNPTAKLSVTSGDDARIKIYSNGGSVAVIDAVANTDDATNRWLSINPTGGRVGIGTLSPSYNLHVFGSNPSITIDESSSSNSNIIFARGGSAKWYLLQNYTTPTDNIAFYDVSTGTKAFQINPGGNVGIATSSPVSKLDVNGGVGIGAYAGVNTAPANGLIVSGNVGIGTSSPVTKLDVRGSSGNTINSVCNDATNGTSWGSSGMKAGLYGSAGSGSTQFQAGVYGYQIGSGLNSGGVVGAYSSGVWGALGYVDGTSTSYGGYFTGNVHITGTLSKGGGTFKIDHPLDPENKYLYHSFVESPDMMNIYNDNVVTDNQGFATIKLPDYFSALNKDFRYQLTPIGQFAQAMVFTEIDETTNSFIIKTDKPNVKVSWQVTGVRKDAFANANRVVAEVNKHSSEKGKYLHPEVHGKSKTLGIHYTGDDSKEK